MHPIPTEPAPPPAALRLGLDREALAANWRTMARLSGKARTGAAVKANGYGLGVAAVVPALRDAGCEDWFVAHWSEVPPLLGLVPAERIAVLHGPITPADAAFARATGVRPVLNSPAQVALWRESGGGVCDVMVDTGMNRLGLDWQRLGEVSLAALDIDTCHSHLASADADVAQNAVQQSRFGAVRTAVAARRYSLANSAGVVLGPDYHHDLTRPGLALYGGIARRELDGVICTVVRPEAAVIQLRDVAAGESVGYNATFTATGPMRIAILSLGYADGILRAWSGKGAASTADGAQLPVIGRVSMDMLALDARAAPMLREGDWLRFDYDLAAAAKTSGLSQYELLTVLGNRFERI